MSSNWVNPRMTMTQPAAVRRQPARAFCSSDGATNPSTSGAPAGVRRRNAPSRGESPAPSDRVRNDTAAIEVGSESSAGAIAAPAAARDRTCSTATAPRRAPQSPPRFR